MSEVRVVCHHPSCRAYALPEVAAFDQLVDRRRARDQSDQRFVRHAEMSNIFVRTCLNLSKTDPEAFDALNPAGKGVCQQN